MHRQTLLLCLGIVQMPLCASAQGTFQNLDFEQAKIIINGGGFIATSDAFPGWEVFGNGVAIDQVQRDGFLFLGAGIDDGSDHLQLPPLDGKFSAMLAGTGLIGATMSIGQSGLVPTGSKSLRFYVGGGFSVFFAGQALPLTFLEEGPKGYGQIYGCDISAYAGEYGQLLFEIGPLSSVGINLLDDINFSPLPLPEPSVFALAGLGALLVGWGVLRKRKGHRRAAAGPQ